MARDDLRSPTQSRRRVSRFLRGQVDAAPSTGNYVCISMEREWGSLRASVYLTRTQAKALRDRLDQIVSKP